MTKIIIRNVGPIKEAEFDLNKVNVFMGPQSSGKSTIAKIISYCQWVEKRFILDGEYKDDFRERFMEFHRIGDSYFSDESYISYISDNISIVYSGFDHVQTIEKKNNGLEYVNSKNIYIPAERNFVSAIDNLGKYKRTNDNIMNFVYDWAEIRGNYTSTTKYPILNMGVAYYYNADTDTDMIYIKDKGKDIKLNNASSGLQSLTPLLLPLEYMTGKLFDLKNVESPNEKNERNNVLANYLNDIFDSVLSKEEVAGLKDNIAIEDDKLKKIANLIVNRIVYRYSQFIFEEPEQNLFPETQRDLVYYLLNKVNNKKRDHKLFLTTHSPYILYALNNCMMGYLVKDNMPEDEKEELLSKNSWIDPKLVSVWEIEEGKGTIRPIKNTETGTISKHYFNGIMNEVMEEYYDMLIYLKVGSHEG